MYKKEMSKHCLDLICRFDIAVRGFKSKSFKLSTVKGIKKSKYWIKFYFFSFTDNSVLILSFYLVVTYFCETFKY